MTNNQQNILIRDMFMRLIEKYESKFLVNLKE